MPGGIGFSAGGIHHAFRVLRAPPKKIISDFVVLTGFHPSKRQPPPGTRKLREDARFLSHAVIDIRAMQDRDEGTSDGEDATDSSVLV